MIARISRIIPLLLVMAAIAGVVYLVVAARRSPVRAKEVTVRLFLVFNSALTGFCALFSLYAWFENNGNVLDMALTFLAVAIVALGVTLLCRWRFYKNHPNYRKKPKKTQRLD